MSFVSGPLEGGLPMTSSLLSSIAAYTAFFVAFYALGGPEMISREQKPASFSPAFIEISIAETIALQNSPFLSVSSYVVHKVDLGALC